MKRRIATILLAAAFAVSAFGGALAAQDTVGEPGDANCFGLRTSFHATFGESNDGTSKGNPAQRAGKGPHEPHGGDDFESVQEVQTHVKGNCE